MQAFGRNQMISSAANGRRWSASQEVVSDEFVADAFATGNGLTSSTAPMRTSALELRTMLLPGFFVLAFIEKVGEALEHPAGASCFILDGIGNALARDY